jgi:MFS transporter, PAT family, beta-lactamase induction signal transducer AmpG
MKMPNPIGTKTGRLFSFFLLYLTEGIPYGFATLALLTQLRRADIPAEQLGAFTGFILLPWSFKWVMGPFVDLISFGKLGHRKAWILFSQILMCLTLLVCIPLTASVFKQHDDYAEAKSQLIQDGEVERVAPKDGGKETPDDSPLGKLKSNYLTDLSLGLWVLTIVFFIHNWFAATQDVAIDALAVNVLKPEERGLANGMMFAGAYTGQAVGGSLVLIMMDGIPFMDGLKIPFEYTYWFVSAGILFVTVFVVIPLREKARETANDQRIANEIKTYSKTAAKAIFTNRNGIIAFFMAILPAGALALSKELQTVLGVELGLTDGQIGELTFVATIISAFGCVLGGILSDRLGRRTMLALYIVMSSIPTLWLAFEMKAVGWTGTKPPNPEAVPPVIAAFWSAVTVHSLFLGLIYGTRFAVFMDITNPKVAGTQFTAYMSLGNVVLSYTAFWQGYVITNVGYTTTLFIDCGLSMIYIGLLPFLVPTNTDHEDFESEEPDQEAESASEE